MEKRQRGKIDSRDRGEIGGETEGRDRMKRVGET